MKAKQISGIPEQKKGGFHDTESRHYFDSPFLARQHFEILKKRFFSINQWQNFCSDQLADFKLFNDCGTAINDIPQIGNFIRIDIPGPGNTEAKGYDWVKIICIKKENTDISETILINCSPSSSPQDKNTHIAHFYSSEATSTFMISWEHNLIKTAVYGRNETPNFNTDFFNKIRSLLIAIGGIVGVAKIQWKCLTDGLLKFK
ncbi:hypothetical protein [Chryseobacterium sp. JUb7]|uniref:hypothetical protein n=1 Tax=Chryseobacterium sp. JUb7 TaxID=2940599 RepID=UPI0021691809|nr:hypothetical protein [Chryseobacterium sp. JUb7]MCS3529331.1 hypothetical protein [Chryseobacterium sp. JUb7]